MAFLTAKEANDFTLECVRCSDRKIITIYSSFG